MPSRCETSRKRGFPPDRSQLTITRSRSRPTRRTRRAIRTKLQFGAISSKPLGRTKGFDTHGRRCRTTPRRAASRSSTRRRSWSGSRSCSSRSTRPSPLPRPEIQDLVIRDYAFVPGRLTVSLWPARAIDLLIRAKNDPAALDQVRAMRDLHALGGGAKPWTLVTYAFLHGGWSHVLLNTVWLLAFGPPVARRFGAARFSRLHGRDRDRRRALAHWARRADGLHAVDRRLGRRFGTDGGGGALHVPAWGAPRPARVRAARDRDGSGRARSGRWSPSPAPRVFLVIWFGDELHLRRLRPDARPLRHAGRLGRPRRRLRRRRRSSFRCSTGRRRRDGTSERCAPPQRASLERQFTCPERPRSGGICFAGGPPAGRSIDASPDPSARGRRASMAIRPRSARTATRSLGLSQAQASSTVSASLSFSAGDRHVDVDVAEPMARLLRQEGFVHGAEGRVGVDGDERVVVVAADAGEFVGERVGAPDDRRRRGLLGRAQQADALEAEADPQLAARPGQRDRQDEAGDRRRHPQDQRRGDERGREQGDDAEQRVRAMAAHDAGEGNGAVVAALRVPAGVASGQDLQHRSGLDQHHDRRERRRDEDLEEGRGDQRRARRPIRAGSGRRRARGRGRGTSARAGWRSSARTAAARVRSRTAARPGNSEKSVVKYSGRM